MAASGKIKDFKGQPVFRASGSEIRDDASKGFSLIGTWTVLITDHPAVYIHDSGGLLAEEVTLACEDATKIALAFVESSRRLQIRAPMGKGRVLSAVTTAEISDEQARALTDLGATLSGGEADARFATPLPVSVRLNWERPENADEKQQGGAEEHEGEIQALIAVTGNRLVLDRVSKTGKSRVFDIPLTGLSAEDTGARRVTITTGAVVGGLVLKSVTVFLPVAAMRRKLVREIGGAGGGQDANGRLMDTVRLAGRGAPREVECFLREDAIVLAEKGAPEKIATISLGEPDIRVSGSANEFVVYTPATGALAISGASDLFGRRLAEHPELTRIARRTAAEGPYPVLLEGGVPALVRVADGKRTVETEAGVTSAAIGAALPVGLSLKRAKAVMVVGAGAERLRLTAQPDLAEALHGALRTAELVAQDVALEDRLRTIVGLEEDWLLGAVAGPVCLAHHALLRTASGEPDSDPDLSGVLDPAGTPATMAPLLAAALDDLKRHFDMVVNVLPAFVGSCDLRVAAPDGPAPDWLKPLEARSRMALAQAGRALGEVVQMRGQLARIAEFDPANLPKPDYTGAALASVVGGAINPVLAIGGISQAISAFNAGEMRTQMAQESGARVWHQVLADWNAFATELLPVICYNVTESLFPLRWEVARQIARIHDEADGEERTALAARVARRLAVLDVRRHYPAEAGAALTNGMVAGRIRAARDGVRYDRFAAF